MEEFVNEQRRSMIVDLYVSSSPHMSLQEIATKVGLKSRTSIHRVIRQEMHDRQAEHRERAWARADEMAEKVREASVAMIDFNLDSGAPPPPNVVTAAASALTAYARYYGLQPEEFVTVNHQGEVTVSVADSKRESALRLMQGLDALNLDNVGSGRSPEEQVAVLTAAGSVLDVVDAEIIEPDEGSMGYDDETDEDSGIDDDVDPTVPGRWESGKFIPWWDDNAWLWSPPDDLEPDPSADPDPTYYNGPTSS